MAYDPYSQQDSQPQGMNPFSAAGGLVGGYIHYRYGFLHPGTYSPNKGVYSPINIGAGGKNFGKYWDVIKNSKAKGFLGKAGVAWSNRKMIKGGMLGGDWLGETKAAGMLKGQITSDISRLYKQQGLKIGAEARGKLVDATINWAAQGKSRMTLGLKAHMDDVFSDSLKINDKLKLAQNSNQMANELSSRVNSTIEGSAALKRSIGKGKLASRVGQRWGGVAARGALRLGRAASWVGLAFMVKDVAMMIGEPIGRVMINKTDQMMQQYDERFMPEMGGKLSAAYMTYGAATERQRAVQSISKSYINGRSAYGQEAMYMHS